MKRYLSPEIVVGIFALAGLAVIIFMSLEVSETNIARGAAKKYTATFDSVTGVVNKSPIETAGIRVGYIDSITLDGTKAKVTVRVIPDLIVYKNASLSIKDRGILGDRYLRLDPGTPEYPPLEPGGEILNVYSQSDMDKIMSTLGGAAENLDKFMKSMTGDNKGAAGGMMGDIRELARNLNELVKNNREGIDHIVANISEITSSLKQALGDGTSLKETGENLRAAIKNIETAMESFSRIAKKIDSGEGTIGKLVNDDTTVKKLDSAIDGINDYIDSTKKIQTSLSYRGEYLTDAKELQNIVALKIQPKPDKYLKFELIDAPVGTTRVTDTTVYVPPGSTVAATTKTVETTDKFRFSLEVAKRFYDLNLKFGIMRNRGGAGFDYYLLDDLLQLSFEAFDFSRFDNRPQLRSYATFTLYKYFLLTGGVDDMIDKYKNRNYFFGAGFSFTDNDLKTILSSFKIPGI